MDSFRLLRQIGFVLALLLCAIGTHAQGTCPSGLPITGTNCWFVSAAGSDSNNGTSESTPFLHAPYMSTATSNAAAATVGAGKGIIFRGGDTWHFGNSGASPFAGSGTTPWNVSVNGTATNCQLNPAAGAIVTTSCIYVGVDQTWFTGASWTRPILSGDNPISTSVPGSCTYQDGFQSPTVSRLFLMVGNYTIVDNFEVSGYCWDMTTGSGTVNLYSVGVITANFGGAGSEVKNCYFHGWSQGPVASGATCAGNGSCDADEYYAINGPDAVGSYFRVDHNVFDGSDSTFGNLFGSYGDASGIFTRGGGEVDHNVLVHVSNIVKDSHVWIYHHNYIDALYEPKPGGTHGNVFEMPPGNYTISTYGYDNLVLRTNIGETFDLYPGSAAASKTGYFFGNIMANPDGFAGTNCYLTEGNGTGGPGPLLFFNNTNVSGCLARTNPGNGSTSGTFTNNHQINYSPAALSSFSTITTTTNGGNNLFPTTTVANSQGYTVGGNWAPTSATCNGIATNCTVGAGANLASTCSGMDNSEAAADCLNGANPVTYNQTNHTAVDSATVARGSSWDAGAYQFSTSSVAPPTFSPVGGTYLTTQTVSLSTTTAGATICFTTDGTIPTESGNICLGGTTQTYTTGLTVSSNQTIKALGTKSGLTDSSVASANYVIGVVPVAPSLLMLQVN